MTKLSSPNMLLPTVFVCGFVVMAFEIIGSRVLAPFMGTSTYVWVSIIGVILLAMSLGYSFGGSRADRNANQHEIGRFMLLAALCIGLMNLGKNQFLTLLGSVHLPLLVKSTSASFILFGLPSFFLAAVFPYALRLALTSVTESGKLAGRFYATSTLGSILGTFLSATVLIPTFGTTHILWILAALLIAFSIWNGALQKQKTVTIIALLVLASNIAFSFYPRPYLDFDSHYNRIWILDAIAQGLPTRYLSLNGHVNSGMWVDDPIVAQLYPYSDYFRLADHFHPNFERTLMLGAGAYTFPKLYQHLWPNRDLDVVEIDPKLTELSMAFFNFNPRENTQIFHEDARTFLSSTDQTYDVIISDVFTSPLEVPFQMTTTECYQLHYNHLSENGVLILNVLGNAEGDHSAFLKSQVRTAASVFDRVLVFEVEDGTKSHMKNNMVVALKSAYEPSFTNSDSTIQNMLDQLRSVDFENARLLTDDFAPANWLLRE
jgi:spermidine synthase